MADFVKVANAREIPEGTMKMVTLGTDQVCLANVGEGKFYAIGNVCTHMRCPLARGKLEGYVVTCPCHGSQFDVRTGEVKRPPAGAPEPVYEVKIDGADVLLKPGPPGPKGGVPARGPPEDRRLVAGQQHTARD